MKYFGIVLVCFIAVCNLVIADKPQTCAKLGQVCQLSEGKFVYSRSCCEGICEDGFCRVKPDNKKKTSPSRKVSSLDMLNSLRYQGCVNKFKNNGIDCGNNTVRAYGNYCSCGCSSFTSTYLKIGEPCIPTVHEYKELIVNCREYYTIDECPDFVDHFLQQRCKNIKKELDVECDQCGGNCLKPFSKFY